MLQRLQHTISSTLLALRQRGSFAQNLAVTFSGSAAVTAIGVLLTPVMSRIYPPASYGQFAVYSSIVSNISIVSTLAYPWALLLPKTRRRFLALVQLSVVLTLAMLVLTLVAIALFGPALRRWLHAEALAPWMYLIPPIIAIFNLNSIMNSWYLRKKEFKKRAGIDVVTTLAGRGITIGYGWQFHGSLGGLIIGDVFNKLTAFVSLLRSGIHRELGELWRTFSWRKIRSVAVEYRDYPIYSLPTGYLSVVATQLPIFMLTTSFGTTMVGLYSFSTSLMEIPISLIGSAVAPVFQQKATETFNEQPERLRDMCLQLYNKLLYVGLLPFGIVTIYGDLIFKYAFGARWEMAGLFTAYLGYYYVFRLASLATSPVLALLRRQRVGLVSTGLLLATRAAGLGIGMYYHDVRLAMLLFGVGSLVTTFLIDMYILRLLHVAVGSVMLRTTVLIISTLLVLKASRMALEHLLS